MADFIRSITVTFANDQTAVVDSDGDSSFSPEDALFSASELDIVQRLATLVQEENGNA